jgi:hypothetical protein
MAEPFLINDFFVNLILPFVLVFTLIFAVLEKSQLLGDGKKQINAIIGIVIGLFLIAFPPARDIVVLLMPFLAVSIVILLVFMLLYGFIVGKTDGDILGYWWKVAFGAILAVALVTALLFITGHWDIVYDYTFGDKGNNQFIINGIMIAVIIGAIVAVLRGDGGK